MWVVQPPLRGLYNLILEQTSKSNHYGLERLVKLVSITQHLEPLLKIGTDHKPGKRFYLAVRVDHLPSSCSRVTNRSLIKLDRLVNFNL